MMASYTSVLTQTQLIALRAFEEHGAMDLLSCAKLIMQEGFSFAQASDALQELADRGWISFPTVGYYLTGTGRNILTALDEEALK